MEVTASCLYAVSQALDDSPGANCFIKRFQDVVVRVGTKLMEQLVVFFFLCGFDELQQVFSQQTELHIIQV